MIKPYFETELGKLYCGDALSYMKTFKDNHFDLCLTDPPYGINADKMEMGSGDHQWDKTINDWDNKIPEQEIFAEIDRISKNYILWGGNYFTEYLLPSENWIIWDKNNPNLSFSEAEMAYVKHGKKIRIFKRYSANMNKVHPTQKPTELYNYCLENYSNVNNIILDCYAGSGTIGVSCNIMNRRWIGIEISEKYCEISAKRIETEASQGKFELGI